MKTRNGKIARLPRTVREELNRRLEDGEPGNQLVAWLNAQPEMQVVLQNEFGGRAVNEQNVSEWKQGGFLDWQREQERREFVRQLAEAGGELNAEAGVAALSERLGTVLMAELAGAMHEVLASTQEPEARLTHLQALAGRFAQLRREESHAARANVVAERWEREKAKEEEDKRWAWDFMPRNAFLLQRLYLSGLGKLKRKAGDREPAGESSGVSGRSGGDQAESK